MKTDKFILFNIIFWALVLIAQQLLAAGEVVAQQDLTNEELLARSETWKQIIFSWWAEIWAIVSTIINFVLLTKRGQSMANAGKDKINPFHKS